MSNVGVMKGEVGGDWEERLDKARVRHRHQPMGERKNNQNLRPDQSQTCGSSVLLALFISISHPYHSAAAESPDWLSDCVDMFSQKSS